MNNQSIFLLLTVALFLFLSCEKESKEPDPEIITFDGGVIISCEGSFGGGNASVYFLDPVKSLIAENIYQSVNDEKIGDVLQSITFDEDHAYIVVNNSGKILITDRSTFEKKGSIEGLKSPTEIRIKDDKGYIGNLFYPYITIADTETMKVTDSLYAGVSSEKIHIEEDRIFILSHSEYQGRVKNHIYTIDLKERSLDSIAVGSNPIDWTYNDRDNQLYIFCQGRSETDPASIFTINTITAGIESEKEITGGEGSFSKLAYDRPGERVLFSLGTGIHSYDLQSDEISADPIVPSEQIQFLYALAVDPVNGNIYIGDALDFNQRGDIYIFDPSGTPIASGKTGVGPNNFYFN